MKLISNSFEIMDSQADIWRYNHAMSDIIKEFEIDPKSDENSKQGKIFLSGESFKGILYFQVNNSMDEIADGEYQDSEWLSAKEIVFEVSKDFYNNLYYFAERIEYDLYNSRTGYTWKKGYSIGTTGTVLDKNNKVQAIFERSIFGKRKISFKMQ